MAKSDIFKDKILLITGGTGSFGNAVLRRFLKTNIKQIRIFSRDEKKQDDMRHEYNDLKIKYFIGDVRSVNSLYDAVDGVDYIFHAAALKQVPSCEFYPIEAVLTNIIGADNVLSVATQAKVNKVVILSTDKAVLPINAMGMSKGLMEKVMIARSRLAEEKGLKFCGTRYGNVMASRGSVIPLFIQQIKNKQPITITNPAMTRFMMSLDDAVNLVIFAFNNASSGDIFVQKSPAATILTLAESLKQIFESDVPVKIMGTRCGEKLHETLLTSEERSRSHDLGDYYKVHSETHNLNYNLYFNQGINQNQLESYNSANTHRLTKEETIKLLLKLPEIQSLI